MSVELIKKEPLKKEPLKDSCLVCEFCFEGMTDPNTLQKQSICRRYPPVSYPIPAQGGVAMITTFPNVTKDMICFEFKEMKRILE
jgi:hypothetical protein